MSRRSFCQSSLKFTFNRLSFNLFISFQWFRSATRTAWTRRKPSLPRRWWPSSRRFSSSPRRETSTLETLSKSRCVHYILYTCISICKLVFMLIVDFTLQRKWHFTDNIYAHFLFRLSASLASPPRSSLSSTTKCNSRRHFYSECPCFCFCS